MLLINHRWAAAYYLAGYAVECGLKSAVIRRLGETDFVFRDRKAFEALAKGLYTHDLASLVEFAGLEREFGEARRDDPDLARNWGVAKEWKETSRYDTQGETEARALLDAISQTDHGVLPWIRSRW